MCIYNGQHVDLVIDKLTGNLPNGFYIDVGANNPIDASVTKLFYDRGWCGINIEPLEDQYQSLIVHRPKDINLRVACGAKSGEVELFHQNFAASGLTTANKELALMGQTSGIISKVPSFTSLSTFKITMLTLAEICDTYVKEQSIDFLKIDVEGMEKDVILGMNWQKYKPKIICIEAVEPHSLREAHQEWEPLLLAVGYVLADKDLYNRYYKEA
jgi:FkbM family methyltransferase